MTSDPIWVKRQRKESFCSDNHLGAIVALKISVIPAMVISQERISDTRSTHQNPRRLQRGSMP